MSQNPLSERYRAIVPVGWFQELETLWISHECHLGKILNHYALGWAFHCPHRKVPLLRQLPIESNRVNTINTVQCKLHHLRSNPPDDCKMGVDHCPCIYCVQNQSDPNLETAECWCPLQEMWQRFTIVRSVLCIHVAYLATLSLHHIPN